MLVKSANSAPRPRGTPSYGIRRSDLIGKEADRKTVDSDLKVLHRLAVLVIIDGGKGLHAGARTMLHRLNAGRVWR
jgi:hypothetical protein